MEFPPETYDVFEANQFETARARLAGDAFMEVMLQMRPNGRCLDHYRIALDGTVLETQVVAPSAFRAPVLAKYRLTYQAWPRDLKIRRNMKTTAWVDVTASSPSQPTGVHWRQGGRGASGGDQERVRLHQGDEHEERLNPLRRGGPDRRMWLEHQALPGTAEALTSKPTFDG
jgi:hypothetical protein